MKSLLAEMTRPEAADAIKSGAFAIIILGSNEQHGPHLPLETDSRQVWEVATRALEKVKGQVKAFITPCIWVGYSTHHLDFPGSISLTPHTYMNVITEVCESLIHQGVRKILIINGHGGNRACMSVATRCIKDKHRDVLLAAMAYWDLVKDLPEWKESGHGCHACEFETDLMLVLRPELVDMQAAIDVPVYPRSKYFGRGMFEETFVDVPEDTIETSQSGCQGLPRKATKEAGEKLLKTLVDRMGDFLIDFERWKIGEI